MIIVSNDLKCGGASKEYECRECGQCERNTKEEAYDGLVRDGICLVEGI